MEIFKALRSLHRFVVRVDEDGEDLLQPPGLIVTSHRERGQ